MLRDVVNLHFGRSLCTVLCFLCFVVTGARQTFIVGQFHPLGIVALQGLSDDLYRYGRLRIRPFGWTCGDVGSGLMDSAVQPPCVGNVCAGALSRMGDMAVWESVRITRVGIYTLCWCRPTYACKDMNSCCLQDSEFQEPMDEVEVAGPAWVTVSPVLGQGFRFELHGPEVLPGNHALLRLRSMGACGFSPLRNEEELQSFQFMTALPEHDMLPLGTTPNAGQDLNISGVLGSQIMVAYLYRHLAYSICWCARNCFKDGLSEIDEEAFSATVGEFFPRGPDTENVVPQHVVAGASFSLVVQGDRLSMKDRILVPEASVSCGDPSTAHAISFRQFLCGRGEGACMATPGNGPPTSYQDLGEVVGEAGISFVRVEWSPIQIDTPGTYRICWCVDDSWDPVKLESHGLCGEGSQFTVQAGLVVVQGTDGDRSFGCLSFRPCHLEVKSDLPFDPLDSIMIVAPPPTSTNSLATICGRGTNGLQVTLSTFQAIFETSSTTPAIFTTTMNENESTTTRMPTASYYLGDFALGSAGQAGLYRVCYCSHVANGPCDDPVAFAQFAGILNISGKVEYQEALAIHQQCLASAQCRFNITGVWAMQLSFLDSFRAVPKDVPCDTAVDSSSYPHFTLVQRLELASGWMSEFTHQAGAEEFYFAGDYKLCYCQRSLAPNGCAPEEHTQEMGVLQIIGSRSSSMQWTCRQGASCALVVHGWRVAVGDAVRLVTGTCGDPWDDALAIGFDYNPAVSNRSDNLTDGVLLHFELGRAFGSGRFKVCLCVAAVARSRQGCSQTTDYAQPAGELLIEGLLRSVTASTQPSTRSIATVLVEVIQPGNAMSVACAVSNQSLDKAPTSFAVLTCEQSIPGCLGSYTLPWRAEEGFNLLHVPLSGTATEGHVWCTGDISLCPTGRCVLPPTEAGLVLPLRPGTAWASLTASMAEQLELQVFGDPLNTQGGYLKVVTASDGCPEVDRPGEIISPFEFGSPVSYWPQQSIRWVRERVDIAGRFWLCWCDRSYGADCALWQHIGEVLLAGPINVTGVPSTVELGEAINVTLNGVNLTSQDRLYISEGSRCTEGLRVAPEELSETVAGFQLDTPRLAGAYVVCWTRGDASLALASGFSRESRDCVLGDWELAPMSLDYPHLTGEGQACSRPCGGGVYELRRAALAQAVGGGTPCPRADSLERSRFLKCNVHRCPEAMTLNAYTIPNWVRPSVAFQVIVQGYFLEPSEDRILLLAGEASQCGEAPNSTGDQNSSVLRDRGAACARPRSNSTFLECGNGVASIKVNQPGKYRLCVCHAASVWPGYTNLSGSMVASRERCSLPEDYALMPSNGSLLEITETSTIEEEGTVGDPLGILGLTGLRETGRERSDSILILGLLGATLLYCCAVFCACWFWRYRWRKRSEWRRLTPAFFKNSLVAKATRAAWEAYNRAVTDQDECAAPTEPVVVEGPEQLADLTSMQGCNLTPPGTGVSMKSGSSLYSSSTSSTRATTPGNRPSLLKMNLNRDMQRPVSPIMGGSFLDLPLAGKGSRSQGASPSRPCTAQTVVTINEEPGSDGKPDSPKSEEGQATPPDAEEASPAKASRLLEIHLPGLQRKLAKLREEQSDTDESPLEAPRAPVLPPSMAPPSLPGQLHSKEASKTTAEANVPPSEVPQVPLKQPPMMAVRPPLPPPKRAQVPAEPVGELVPEVEEATGQAPMPQAPATPLARKPEIETAQPAEAPDTPLARKPEVPTEPAEVPLAPETPEAKPEVEPVAQAEELRLPEAIKASSLQEEPETPKAEPETPKESSPSTPGSKDESPTGPKLSSWLTDMRSRMANKQAAEPKASSSKLAPSSSLRSAGRKPPMPPPRPDKPKQEKPAQVPPLALSTVKEDEPTMTRCFPGPSGVSSKTSASELSLDSEVPGEVKEPVVEPVAQSQAHVEAAPTLPPSFAQRPTALPTGNWDDSQEKLRQEWYEKLAAGVDAHEGAPRRNKASLRGAARPGASLRGSAAASAANSAVPSMAPSRASPANSPREDAEPRLPPPPPPKAGPKRSALGPGPALPGSAAPNWAM